jgi:hypothetical protein
MAKYLQSGVTTEAGFAALLYHRQRPRANPNAIAFSSEAPVRAKKTRQYKNQGSVLIPSEPKGL